MAAAGHGAAYTFLFLTLHLIAMRGEIAARKIRAMRIAEIGEQLMDFAAPHMGFVIASYGLSALLIIGLALYIVLRDRRLRAEAAKLDQSRRWNDT